MRLGGFKIISVLLFFAVFTASTACAGDPLADVFPTSGFSKDWILRDKPVLYDRENLFDHIDGEAELYFPFGFELLASGTYANRQNPETWLVADVYRMGSVLDAFGIYSNYRRPNADFVKAGTEGFISPSQLLFYQDRYFVRIQVTGATGVGRVVLMECAKGISGQLTDNMKPPAEIEIFNVLGVESRSERYVAKSLLGYEFFRRGIIADAGRGNKIFQVFLVPENSPEAASKAVGLYISYLESEGQKARPSKSRGRLTLVSKDPLYGKFYIEQSGKYILGAARLQDLKQAKAVIEKLWTKLEQKSP